MNKIIEQFYTSWKANLDDYLRGYVYTKNGQKHKTRFAFLMLEKYLNKFLSSTLSDEERIIILPGIRGVGKTTLLSQLYFFDDFVSANHHNVKQKSTKIDYKLYISADRLLAENISLKDFFEFLEKEVQLRQKQKVLLLIDEIQYDPQWSLFLKLFFDKTKSWSNVIVFATGSSAIFLNQKNQDLVRRTVTERVLPEKFNEYLLLHKDIFPQTGLSAQLKEIIFHSQSAQKAFSSLQIIKPHIVEKLASVSDLEARKKDYFLRGSFPFSAEIDTRPQAMERIKNMVLINIVQKDLILSGDFDAETLVKVPDLLFLLANSDEISVGKLAQVLNISPGTLNKVLDSLVKAEILFELKPYGQPHVQVRKSSKFLFISPNIRAGLLSGFIDESIKGKFLEDYMALIFEKEFKDKGIVLFDYSKSGADFVLRFFDNSEIVIEVGFGKEETAQVENTMKKTSGRAKYAVIIGSQNLELVSDNIIKIPLNYFLLM